MVRIQFHATLTASFLSYVIVLHLHYSSSCKISPQMQLGSQPGCIADCTHCTSIRASRPASKALKQGFWWRYSTLSHALEHPCHMP